MQPSDTEFSKMVVHAERALLTVLDPKKNERVSVITDQECEDVALAFKEACQRLGLSSELVHLGNRSKGHFRDISPEVERDLNHSDIYINTFVSYADETPFRIKLLDLEMKKGARIAHAPGIDKKMLLEGALTADFESMWDTAKDLMDAMADAVEVHITTEAGTDVRLKVANRQFQTDIKIKKNELGNLPAGEIWCAPLEDGADGIVIVDGTIGDFGFPPSPVKIWIKNGKVADVECDDREFTEKLKEVLHADEMSDVIGELGIGLNKGAKLIGNMLVDEKAAGTIHIAFGNNIDFYGGKNDSSMHRDFLVRNPDMTITYSDGSRKKIMEKGSLLL